MISVCLLTIDRYWTTRYVIETLLSNTELEIELLVLDNGSSDIRTIEFIENLIASKKFNNLIKAGTIREVKNIGVAQGLNKLIKESSGEYICIVGNDILLNKNWLNDLLYYNKTIKDSGITAIHCVKNRGKFSPLLDINDEFVNIWKTEDSSVYGTWFFNKSLLEVVGIFDDRLSKFGLWDSQYCWRLCQLGYNNFYIPEQSSFHIEDDFNEEYKSLKAKEFKKAQENIEETKKEMVKSKKYKYV
jgi:GT2 family glycosyltransferase